MGPAGTEDLVWMGNGACFLDFAELLLWDDTDFLDAFELKV